MPYVTEDNLTDVVLERWKDIPDRLADPHRADVLVEAAGSSS